MAYGGWDEYLNDIINVSVPDYATACYNSTPFYPEGVCYKYEKKAPSNINFIQYNSGTCTSYSSSIPFVDTKPCKDGICPLDNKPCL
jgi:hypothetical protein